MPRYIDADKAKANPIIYFIDGKETFGNYIDSLPTEDVVEVTRCKDCKYGEYDINSFNGYTECRYCKICNESREFEDFCSYGERKE